MKMFVKDTNDRYLKVDDIDLVFTDIKDEAFNFSSIDINEFLALKLHIEATYDTELETIFE